MEPRPAWATRSGTADTALINSYGELTNSRRHEIKAFVTYQIPRIDVMVGAKLQGLSGAAVYSVRCLQQRAS